MPSFAIEETYRGTIAGVDEAGRGPWAGPVVAAAVVLNPLRVPEGIDDSKKISKKKRLVVFEQLQLVASVGVGMATAEEIDELNILQASLLAMQRAVAQLPVCPDIALIDGIHAPKLQCRTQTVIRGDSVSLSIAAASIIAKVTRDRIMADIAQEYPHYRWEKNAGYGTKDHQAGLASHGVSPHHRKSFKPVAKLVTEGVY